MTRDCLLMTRDCLLKTRDCLLMTRDCLLMTRSGAHLQDGLARDAWLVLAPLHARAAHHLATAHRRRVRRACLARTPARTLASICPPPAPSHAGTQTRRSIISADGAITRCGCLRSSSTVRCRRHRTTFRGCPLAGAAYCSAARSRSPITQPDPAARSDSRELSRAPGRRLLRRHPLLGRCQAARKLP